LLKIVLPAQFFATGCCFYHILLRDESPGRGNIRWGCGAAIVFDVVLSGGMIQREGKFFQRGDAGENIFLSGRPIRFWGLMQIGGDNRIGCWGNVKD
jgi:hypothetical protein